MNVAEVLRAHGLAPVGAPSVPTCPQPPRASGDTQTLVASHVPTVPTVPTEKYRGSSKAADADATTNTRAALLALADRLGVDRAAVVRIPSAELPLWAGVPAELLPAYLLAADDTTTRQAGKVPLDDTAAIHCAHCGPVYAHADIAAVLPVVNGWPRALGCPWCAIRKAGGYVPRPHVTCEGCASFRPDPMNPAAGMGGCASGHGYHYPMQRHGCGDHKPTTKGTDHD